MTKPVLPGSTGYAPIIGAELPVMPPPSGTPPVYTLPDEAPEWGTPEHSAYLQQLGRIGFVYGHMGEGGPDLDKQDAIDNDEHYDVTPIQSGRV